ncbi:MAG: nucleoside recognition domain-containing protein, partial [Candidatus Bathyarchaeia archaeon]
IIGSVVLTAMAAFGLADSIMEAMGPITVGWLGLPLIAGIPLIFGVLRKELTLILLAQIAGTTNFAIVMTARQMIVFSLVTMIYIPCIATIAALIREFGWKRALGISLLDITLALFLGGLANALLQAFSIA